MKYIIYGLLILVHFAAMTTVLPLLLPTYLALDFAIILVVCIAMITKNLTAGIVGLCFGLLLDLFTAPAFGVYMVFYGGLGVLSSIFFEKTKWDSILLVLGGIFIAYILRDLYLFAIRIAQKTLMPIGGMFIKFSLLSAIITTIVGFVWCLLLIKLHETRSLKPKKQYDFHLEYEEENEWS